MNPGGGLVTMVNTNLRDEPFRQQIRDMFATQTPFVQMVAALGLAGEMTPAVQTIVEGLSAADVAAIRAAVLEMLDRAENRMPLDCNISQPDIDAGAAVTVSVVEDDGTHVIQVRAAGKS